MDAPPSTYAAQIVDKIEGANHQKPQSSTKAQLKRLFSPILQADREGELDGGLDESLEVNQRLVVVTVQACLLSPSTVDPFQDAGEARGLQIDCLSVIEVVVRRRPEALLSCPLSTLGPLNSEAPVFLWLIPNLLNCLLDEYGEAVRASVRRTLSVMFMVSGRSSKLKLGLNPILKYGQGCVNGKNTSSLAYLLLISRETYFTRLRALRVLGSDPSHVGYLQMLPWRKLFSRS